MKVTLASGKTIEAINVEEIYSPRAGRGTTLNIRMNSDESVEALRDTFTAEETAAILVGDGEKAAELKGYTVLDSVRKIYNNDDMGNTVVDLVKEG